MDHKRRHNARHAVLETERLFVRPFTLDDLNDVHRILDIELADADFGATGAQTLDERREWLHWTVSGYDQLAQLHQPPYGERAVILKDSRELIGVVGYVPCLDRFGQLASSTPTRFTSTEFGLYWAIAPAQQRKGYATEAARAMVDHARTQLRLERIVATTTHDNAASIGVMRKLGMRIETNPFPDPPWLQVVGVLELDAS